MTEPCVPQSSGQTSPAEPAESEPGIYSALPPEEPTAGPEPIYTGLAGLLDMEEDRAERRQCSLSELMALVTLAAMGLSVLSLIPGGLQASRAAGIAGFAALAALVVITVFRPRRFIVHLAWWVLVGAYVVTCVVAVVRSG